MSSLPTPDARNQALAALRAAQQSFMLCRDGTIATPYPPPSLLSCLLRIEVLHRRITPADSETARSGRKRSARRGKRASRVRGLYVYLQRIAWRSAQRGHRAGLVPVGLDQSKTWTKNLQAKLQIKIQNENGSAFSVAVSGGSFPPDTPFS